MGIVVCKQEKSTKTSRQIDKQLQKEKREQSSKIKILLLGNTDTGKSTIVKQMRLCYLDGFNDTERINSIFEIRGNLLEAFHSIAEQIIEGNIDVEAHEETLVRLFATNENKIKLMQESDELNVFNAFKDYSCVKEFLQQPTAFFFLPDNFQYYIHHLPRILSPEYIPDDNDMLYVRTSDNGVYEVCFNIEEERFRLIDIGGHRTEHKKWVHFFDSVHAIIFTLALNSYDQTIEDERRPVSLQYEGTQMRLVRAVSIKRSYSAECPCKNRLQDSIELFHLIKQNKYLLETPLVIFLNKSDLFAKKLEILPFSEYFTDYTNENNVEQVVEYVKIQLIKAQDEERQLFIHSTTATETKIVKDAFADVTRRVLERQMNNTTEHGSY